MASITRALQRVFAPKKGVEPGIYHYRREQDGSQMRFHLRVEEDGSGILSVNASGIIHLNASAALLMKEVLDGKTQIEAVADVQRVYRARRQDIERDYDRIQELITQLETAEDACPIANVEAPAVAPFSREVMAPYRADLALTYQCDNNCQHCYVGREPDEVKPLDFDEWKRVLDRLWNVGVPHVCFTGGEAAMSPHLVPLIEHAEDLGLITGLLTNGRRLANREFVRDLCNAGLDHVQITLESHDSTVHDEMVGCKGAWEETVLGIRNALAEDIYVLTNTTMCTLNASGMEDTLAFIKDLGLRQFAANSLIYTGKAPESGLGIAESDVEPLLGVVTAKAEELGLRFIWYTPTQYCELNPTLFGLGYKRCTAAEYNICIEPDGNVLPCQSYYKPVGNILRDDWKSIWKSPLFEDIRTRKAAPEKCRECPDLVVCGAGCPLREGDRFLCTDSHSEG